MRETTIQDRKKELDGLLEQVRSHPERDWSEARTRIAVLREMIGADAARDQTDP